MTVKLNKFLGRKQNRAFYIKKTWAILGVFEAKKLFLHWGFLDTYLWPKKLIRKLSEYLISTTNYVL